MEQAARSASAPVPQTRPSIAIDVVCILVFAIAIAMRFYHLAWPYPIAGYDEGVYWQSLRAMEHGYRLYRDIYYSQPPLFLSSVYPAYVLLGQDIFAYRSAVAVVSLVGIIGAYVLGKALAGKPGGLVAMLLLLANTPYLRMSQSLQAEGHAVAFGLLSVGMTLGGIQTPSRQRGIIVCFFAGVFLAVATLSKLLAVAALAPVVVAFAIHAIESGPTASERRSGLVKSFAFSIGLSSTIGVTALAFLSDLHAAIGQVVGLHMIAKTVYWVGPTQNVADVASAFAWPTSVLAALGTLAAFIRRDRNVWPLLAWLGATVVLLLSLVPLFPHHLIALVPPLTGLAVLAFAPCERTPAVLKAVRGLAIAAVAVTIVFGTLREIKYYRDPGNDAALGYAGTARPSTLGSAALRADADILRYTKPGDRIVTDAQFAAAAAGRDTPPWLVDTSLVRLASRALTAKDLISASSDGRVRAVLLLNHRLSLVRVYRHWLPEHFQLVDRFGPADEFWLSTIPRPAASH